MYTLVAMDMSDNINITGTQGLGISCCLVVICSLRKLGRYSTDFRYSGLGHLIRKRKPGMAHRSRSRSEDDIDILLDQVEEQYIKPKNSVSRFQTPAKQKAASRTSTRNSKCECTTKAPTDWAEVEELLQDFRFEDANPFGKQNNKSWVRQPLLDHNEPTISVKCSPVYLAGSHEVLGYSVTGNEKPCDSLKCIKCDFDVIALDNFTWDPSTDYLFLRNNMPDFDKLRSRLSKTNGYRAYACQCRHVNISKLTNINSQPQLQWVCKSHNVRANEQKPGSSSSESRSFVF